MNTFDCFKITANIQTDLMDIASTLLSNTDEDIKVSKLIIKASQAVMSIRDELKKKIRIENSLNTTVRL